MTTKELTRMAMVTAAMVVGRFIFSGIPNIQPMTALVILYTLVFGRKEGLLVALMSLVISNLYLGLGPWTFGQLVGYTGIVLGTALASGLPENRQIIGIAVYAGLAGLLYGMILSFVHAVFFGLQIFLPYYIAGIPFDVAHAVGNVGFIIMFYPVFVRLFKRELSSTY